VTRVLDMSRCAESGAFPNVISRAYNYATIYSAMYVEIARLLTTLQPLLVTTMRHERACVLHCPPVNHFEHHLDGCLRCERPREAWHDFSKRLCPSLVLLTLLWGP
jgi:hypothetical protein